MRTILALTMFGLLLLAPSVASAESRPIQVMVLGTFHFGNPALDLHNVQSTDVLAPARQQELAAVARALVTYRPTLVALERITPAPGYVDEKYASFDVAQLAEVRDERVQVGYRVAREAGLQVVHGIDEQPEKGEPDYFPFDRVQQAAATHGQTQALDELLAGTSRMLALFEARQARSSMADLLIEANDAGSLADPAMYYQLLQVDTGEDQPGAELFGYWFMRNAKIFAKLADVARPGDRVLLVYGAGHKHWLEHLVAQAPGFERVDPVPYLERAR